MRTGEIFELSLLKISNDFSVSENRNLLELIFEDLLEISLRDSSLVFPEDKISVLDTAINRLNQSEPVQYITGLAHFYGYKFRVSPAVLIPRMETEELVFEALQFLRTLANNRPKVLDVGTGSGCIAITLQKEMPNAIVLGVDVSEEALQLAATNTMMLEAAVKYSMWDFFDRAQWPKYNQIELVVCNPPYITHAEKKHMSDQVLNYEPELALFAANDDPLNVYQTIFDFAEHALVEGGAILVEINEFWGDRIMDQLSQMASMDLKLIQDMQGKDRMILGLRK